MNPSAKPMALLLSPHQDDAALFASFTLIRDHPLVIDIFDSYIQPARGYPNCGRHQRNYEEMMAVTGILGCMLVFAGFRDDAPDWAGIEKMLTELKPDPEIVYAPAIEDGGHDHHNRLGAVADQVFGNKVRHYMTYTKAGKSSGVPVPYEPAWVSLKLKALACYTSQIALANCVPHFTRGLEEHYQS